MLFLEDAAIPLFRTSQHVKQKVVHLFGLIFKFFSEPRQHSHSKRIWARPCFGEKLFLEKESDSSVDKMQDIRV